MSQLHDVYIVGAAMGIGAANPGCKNGAAAMQASDMQQQLLKHGINAVWQKMITQESDDKARQLQTVLHVNQHLAKTVKRLVQNEQQFVAIGGCHSMAIGTWSGVSNALADKGDIGLIWIDAHMDAHTPETTPSGNIHGMPVATLLGHGHQQLVELLSHNPKIKAENLCLIGVRDYEANEAKLLQSLGVKIFYMEDINALGLAEVLSQALNIVKHNTIGFGFSIDLDGIDPRDAPGTGMHLAHGIRGQEFIEQLHQKIAGDKQLLGIEIAEFDPLQDNLQRTEQLIINMVTAIFSPQEDHSIAKDDRLGAF